MSRLIETIRLLDGQFYNLEYHQQRVTRTFHDLFKLSYSFNLSEILKKDIPQNGLYKCRIIYDKNIESLTFTPYVKRDVKSLKMVDHDTIEYSYKYDDRSVINELFERRDKCDDILIIRKGFVTDSSYSNVIFKKRSEWFTPASCLLEGTMRRKLIDEGKLRVEDIKATDVTRYKTFKLINSMLLDEGPEIDVARIVR